MNIVVHEYFWINGGITGSYAYHRILSFILLTYGFEASRKNCATVHSV